MPICPYAKERSVNHTVPMIRCEILDQYVSPTIFPCFKDYKKCRYYKPPKEKEEKTLIEAEERKREIEVTPVRMVEEPEIITPINKLTCNTCVFYSEASKRCLKLNIQIQDPTNPPCVKEENKSKHSSDENGGGENSGENGIKISKILDIIKNRMIS